MQIYYVQKIKIKAPIKKKKHIRENNNTHNYEYILIHQELVLILIFHIELILLYQRVKKNYLYNALGSKK